MGGWKLEGAKFACYVIMPVGSFWLFNQPWFFQYVAKKLPEDEYKNDPHSVQMMLHLKSVIAQKERMNEEKLLRQQMAFEEARRRRQMKPDDQVN
ncbi:hypothetical protein Ddc_03938 [Ditylenchus destructor]|nr:hypothetical protein Ddc_03938 [Ditylenchus destructor]